MTDGIEFESRAEAFLARVKELNPNVKVTLTPGWTENKDKEFFSQFTLVILS